MSSKTPTNSTKSKKFKRDPNKVKLIRSIFEIEDAKNFELPKKKNIIKINYNKNIYFQNIEKTNEKDIANIISNVTKNPLENIDTNQNENKKLNMNNHNYNNENKNEENINNQNNYNINLYKDKATKILTEYKEKISNKENQFKINTTSNIPIKLIPIQNHIFKKTQKINFDNVLLNNTKNIPTPVIPDESVFMHIPCMNCGNLISLNDIEKHSLTCTKVSEEVMKSESSKYELYSIDYKLKKLNEHLSSILNETKDNNYDYEMQYLSTILLEYVKKVLILQKIDIPTIKEFKKVVKNLENISIKHKNNLSELILIDRTKLLVNEKLKIFKDEYKKEANSRKSNILKSGSIKYEEDLKLKIQQLEKLNAETELEKNKVKNLRKSAGPANRPILKPKISNISEKKIDDSIFSDKENNNISINNGNKVEEIVSDVENNSNILSINTSISNISDYGGSFIGLNKNLGSSSENLNNLYNNNENNKENNYNKFQISNENILNGNKLTFNNENNNNDYPYEGDEKKDKKIFFMEVLKVKFEKLHSSHKGQKINQKYIWEECKRQNIPKENWSQFILGELNNPYKYMEIQKKERRSKSRKPPMDVITEEK